MTMVDREVLLRKELRHRDKIHKEARRKAKGNKEVHRKAKVKVNKEAHRHKAKAGILEETMETAEEEVEDS